jgi:hypothetical protein
MHTDRNGCELKVGDLVYLPCVVTELCRVNDACNLVLETVEKLIHGFTTTLGANSRQVELVVSDNFDFDPINDTDDEAA